MRYPASEKLEIIRLVEESRLPSDLKLSGKRVRPSCNFSVIHKAK
jgi:hypothetical protein